MGKDLKIDVATLDAPHRRALEDVIGHELAMSQQLIISVVDVAAPKSATSQPAQSLEDWTGVYEGLNDEQIEAVDKVAKSRANLTRNLR